MTGHITQTLERHLAAIEAQDARLRAFITVAPETARRDAARVDQALAAGRAPGALGGCVV